MARIVKIAPSVRTCTDVYGRVRTSSSGRVRTTVRTSFLQPTTSWFSSSLPRRFFVQASRGLLGCFQSQRRSLARVSSSFIASGRTAMVVLLWQGLGAHSSAATMHLGLPLLLHPDLASRLPLLQFPPSCRPSVRTAMEAAVRTSSFQLQTATLSISSFFRVLGDSSPTVFLLGLLHFSGGGMDGREWRVKHQEQEFVLMDLVRCGS